MVTDIAADQAESHLSQQENELQPAGTELKSIVFIHPFMLHFHYPRLAALAGECERSGIHVRNIQLAGQIETYRTLLDHPTADIQNICLFPDADLLSIPDGRMRTALGKALQDARPDVIFLYGYSLGIMRWATSWAEHAGVATVLISDSNYTDTRRYWLLEFLKSLFISRLDAGFVGGYSSSLYLQHLGLPENRIVAGYDVVNNDLFRMRNRENHERLPQIRERLRLPEKYFLFVGRMVGCKNILGLLRAYSAYATAVTHCPWDLVLCGDGPEEGTFRQYVKGLPEEIRCHISFRGLVRQPELIDFFSAASCLVLPSTKNESWGLVVNEALACGLPVIVSDRCGCAADLVKNDINGWQFSPLDWRELTARMLQMDQAGAAERERMGRHSEEIISKWGLDRFSSGAMKSARIALEHASNSKVNRP